MVSVIILQNNTVVARAQVLFSQRKNYPDIAMLPLINAILDFKPLSTLDQIEFTIKSAETWLVQSVHTCQWHLNNNRCVLLIVTLCTRFQMCTDLAAWCLQTVLVDQAYAPSSLLAYVSVCKLKHICCFTCIHFIE